MGAGLGGAVIAGTVGADRLDDTARAGVFRADVSVNVGRVAVGRPVSAGFVGLSIEYPAVTAYAGSDPSAINPVFEQLVRNLAPNQHPVLRIGGDGTDRTWWPASHLVRPSGVRYSISSRWLAVARALADATRALLEVRAWATRAPDGRIRLVLINDDVWHSHVVSVRLPERGSQATLERLTAPTAWARSGVALGGQSYGAQTQTGNLAGAQLNQRLAVGPGGYLVTLPAASAAMLNISPSPR